MGIVLIVFGVLLVLTLLLLFSLGAGKGGRKKKLPSPANSPKKIPTATGRPPAVQAPAAKPTPPPGEKPPANPIEEKLRNKESVYLEKLYFQKASTELRDEFVPELEQVAAALLNNPAMKLRIEGGSNKNRHLAMGRARAVAEYLTAGKGISPGRLDAVGGIVNVGDKEKNRRVRLVPF